MKLSKTACIAGVLFIAASLPSTAVSAGVYRVAVVDSVTEPDAVGRQLVFALREEIRKSAGFSLVATDAPTPHLSIVISTMDPDAHTATAGTRTCYSVAFVAPGTLYLSGMIGMAGSDRVGEAAKTILAGLDK